MSPFVVNQEYRNLVMLLVDNGFPDNCSHMCDVWVQCDSRIHVIHKNGGMIDARNVYLHQTHGEWVVFVDSDDCIAIDIIWRYIIAHKDGNYEKHTSVRCIEEILDYQQVLSELLEDIYVMPELILRC